MSVLEQLDGILESTRGRILLRPLTTPAHSNVDPLQIYVNCFDTTSLRPAEAEYFLLAGQASEFS